MTNEPSLSITLWPSEEPIRGLGIAYRLGRLNCLRRKLGEVWVF